MKISVNLATKPFVELRPLFARLRLAMGLLVALAIGLGVWLHMIEGRAAEAQAKMNALVSKTTGFQHERQLNEARMRQPQNKAVLDRAQFLNAVFAEKSFSWTAVMMDLERVLPTGVQVTSIEPGISKEGDVNIRLRVSGDRDRAVALLRNLETSQRFIAPRLAGESTQTAEGRGTVSAAAGPPGVEFEIFSGYNPLPEAVKTVAAGDAGADAPAKVRAKSAVKARTKVAAGGAR